MKPNLTPLFPLVNIGGDQYAGLDRFGRVIDQYWFKTTVGGARIDLDRFQYAFDANSNRLYRANLVNSEFSELYQGNGDSAALGVGGAAAYDPFNRLRHFRRGVLSRSAGANRANTVGFANRSQVWTLDALGNWKSLRETRPDGSTRTLDWNYDAQNLYLNTGYREDDNGNLVRYQDPRAQTQRTSRFDAWNRLVFSRLVPGKGAAGQTRYAYDALGRLIVFEESRVLRGVRELYYSLGGQVLEEWRNPPGKRPVFHYRDHVWGLGYVNALVLTQSIGQREGGRLYLLYDANWNVTALAAFVQRPGDPGPGWRVVERYIYDPYGTVTYLRDNWLLYSAGSGLRDTGVFRTEYLFQGGRLNLSDGLYHFGARKLDPFLGKWMQQDALLYVDGMNLQEFVGSNPVNGVDPSGQFLFTIGGAVAGGLAGGFTGEGGWQRALAGAISGAQIGAGIDLLIASGGGSAPISGALIGAGISSAIGGGLFSGGNVDWGGYGKGQLIGGVAGLTGGYAAALLAPLFGGGLLGGIATGSISGAVGDLAGQYTAINLGVQDRINPYQTLFAAGFGGLVGGAAGYLGSRGLFRPLNGPVGRGNVPSLEPVADAWSAVRHGARTQPLGGYWIKEAVGGWFGRIGLESQVRGLLRLGDRAPDFLYRNGRLITQDAGKFEGGLMNWFSTWIRGSYRLGTPVNDIFRYNIGARGVIFDPTLHPVYEAIGVGAFVTVVQAGIAATRQLTG